MSCVKSRTSPSFEASATTIHALELQSFAGDTARLRVECSKGTYVRVLAEDIGAALGCAAVVGILNEMDGPSAILFAGVTAAGPPYFQLSRSSLHDRPAPAASPRSRT